jgi:hypothetical protein
MTDEQINAAITELIDADPHWKCAKNYCSDLNAMHEAEKVLAPKNWNNFSENWHNYYMHLRRGDADRAIHATARQRAEAFLRTVGKWKATTEESSAVQNEVQE